ncbi:MAG: NAD-dependent epimerase/dehydratase family protein [Thermoflexales bacterium]|nr:NAD-dependent epimerase/dehydratase family protein [Thermoflexales bacterium]
MTQHATQTSGSKQAVCVLGATGFIGGHIARAAVARGWHVRAVRRRPNATGAIADLPVEWIEADLGDASSLARAMHGCSLVFHAAARYPQGIWNVARAVADAEAEVQRVIAAARAAGVQRLIYTSSLSTMMQRCTPNMSPLNETSAYVPGTARSAYFEAKWAMEQRVLAARDLQPVALLPTAVFGPGDVKPTTGRVLLAAARGRMPFYFEAILNVVDVRDVAEAHLVAATQAPSGARLALGGHNLSLRALLETVDRVQGMRRRRLRLPRRFALAVLQAAVMLPDTVRLAAFWCPVDASQARGLLGFAPRPFEETVHDALRWFGAVA